jgi:hypothetical protein
MIRFRSRNVWGVLAAVVVLVGGLLFSLNAAGVISGRDAGHDSREARAGSSGCSTVKCRDYRPATSGAVLAGPPTGEALRSECTRV